MEKNGNIEKFKRKFDSNATIGYALYFPTDGHSPGIMYSPRGVFQIIDFIVAYDGKIISESFSGDLLEPDKMRALTEEKEHFLEILINLNKKHGGVLVEQDEWIWSIEEEPDEDFFIFFRCIANISTGRIENCVFHNNSDKKRIMVGNILEENYNLLKRTLLYKTRESYEKV